MQHKPRNLVIDWINTIWKTDLPPHAKYLACYLRSYMNSKQDMAWPSYATICGETGLARSTVSKYLACLESEGWLIRDKKLHDSTTYIATFPKVIQESERIASSLIHGSTPDELVRQTNYTSTPDELEVVRQTNTNKQMNKQMNKQEGPRAREDQFLMTEDWNPGEMFEDFALARGLRTDQLITLSQSLASFRTHFANKTEKWNHSGWQNKLVGWIKRDYQRTKFVQAEPEKKPIVHDPKLYEIG